MNKDNINPFIAFLDRNRKKRPPDHADPETDTVEYCIICGAKTNELKSTPVSARRCYVQGCGQLCDRCCLELYGVRDLRDRC